MESTISHFSNKDAERSASAHLVIGRDGKIVQMVPFDRIAKHGGWGVWGRIKDISKYSIGVELVNAGPLELKIFGEEQNWVSSFRKKYGKEGVETAKHPHKKSTHGWQIYPKEQIEALIVVLKIIKEEYPVEDIAGHYDITGKWDPGSLFPMDEVRKAVFPEIMEKRLPKTSDSIVRKKNK